ncbi:hypothetical protein PN36_03305 [Candidatus Thiomargarita nelsonii]|uniref:Uncharacterized protein n=1 Tax=Candidatus Thiomargarita nelsonii TaxID=1003181 RepID=A0A4E0QXA2_9GAMM|nr:hypothetical protein PN36_03305 [Candidatus Thiomargarita nelsonii]
MGRPTHHCYKFQRVGGFRTALPTLQKKVVRLIRIAQKRKPIQYDKNDTSSTYQEQNGTYNADKKQKRLHPETKEETYMTRKNF